MSDRSPEEEKLVIWSYYLGIAIRDAEQLPEQRKALMKRHGYRDLAEVLSEIDAHVKAQRADVFGLPAGEWSDTPEVPAEDAPLHDYPALALELRAAALTVAAVSSKIETADVGTRAHEAWGLLDGALDHIDSALRSLEAEEDDEFYPADPPGTADVIAAAIDTNPRKGSTL